MYNKTFNGTQETAFLFIAKLKFLEEVSPLNAACDSFTTEGADSVRQSNRAKNLRTGNSSNHGSDSFSSSSNSSKPQTKSKGSKGKVKRQKLKDVAGNDEWRVNNKLDNKRSPRPAQEIVKEALSLVGQDMNYDVTKWNCEHFVNKLRYGIRRSWQVLKYTLVAGAGYVGGAAGTLLGPLGTVGGAAGAAVYTKALLDKLD
ncbi:retinoic acid receptor responder protein 3-like [Seriola lalandi dorsalis]|uniref:retinoic acid receptor responder protein 3-like n=1 Tax=Seriola lalandi dorsalis TaxID=1841481 RepID=UPI000C6F5BF9|nr:retinoic acid receptor responder protein 3-like [Seriola lalandi dorsalis]